MDVAAAEAQLDAFLRDSKLPLNRSARTIASSMQLPPGGLSKVTATMMDIYARRMLPHPVLVRGQLETSWPTPCLTQVGVWHV
jgi:hypothetical protein